MAECVCVCVWVSQSCLTICNPIDCSLPSILQARILEWVAKILYFVIIYILYVYYCKYVYSACMYHFFIHSSADGHLDCFCVLVIVNGAVVDIGVHVFFHMIVFSGYKPRSGIAWSYGNSDFSILRNLHLAFRSDCTNLHSHWQSKRVLFSPHPLHQFLSADLFVIAILTNVRWYLFLKIFIYFFIYLATSGLSCGMWDLAPAPQIEPRPTALGTWSLSHWTTREVPHIIALICILEYWFQNFVRQTSIEEPLESRCFSWSWPCPQDRVGIYRQ